MARRPIRAAGNSAGWPSPARLVSWRPWARPGLLAAINDAFRDYAPPNGADYVPSTIVTPRIWPRLTAGWCIAWNTELIKETPRTWWDITKPLYSGSLGIPSGYTGGSTLLFVCLMTVLALWHRSQGTIAVDSVVGH